MERPVPITAFVARRKVLLLGLAVLLVAGTAGRLVLLDRGRSMGTPAAQGSPATKGASLADGGAGRPGDDPAATGSDRHPGRGRERLGGVLGRRAAHRPGNELGGDHHPAPPCRRRRAPRLGRGERVGDAGVRGPDADRSAHQPRDREHSPRRAARGRRGRPPGPVGRRVRRVRRRRAGADDRPHHEPDHRELVTGSRDGTARRSSTEPCGWGRPAASAAWRASTRPPGR